MTPYPFVAAYSPYLALLGLYALANKPECWVYVDPFGRRWFLGWEL